jgi:putative tricarboxylic transport membrane protein
MNKRNVSPLRNKETFLGTLLLLASIIFLYGVMNFPGTSATYRGVSPSFFPNLLGAALAVLSIFLIVEGFRTAPARILDLQSTRGNLIRTIAVLGSLILFVALFRLLGFVLMAFIFTAGLQLILGEKRIVRALLVSFTVSAVLYIVLVVLLRVSFPLGIFFS